MSTNGLLKLVDVRPRAAAALAPADDSDPDVLVDVVDAIEPPAIMLLWDDPWIETAAVAQSCLLYGRLELLLVASRVEPGPGMTKLEELLGYAVGRMQQDSYTWPAAGFQAPRVFTIGGVPLLGARITYRVPVTI